MNRPVDESEASVLTSITLQFGGAVAQLGARLDGIEEVVGSNPIGSTNLLSSFQSDSIEPLSEPTRCGGPYVRPAFACIHRLP